MPELKRLKKLPKLDMNPMVDMAFLLVCFFMMTTTFKTDTPTEVRIPESHAELKIPQKDICLITIGKEGGIYLGVDNIYDRREMLNVIAKQHQLNLNDQQQDNFSLTSSFGLPISRLGEFLDLNRMDRKAVPQSGIPLDSLNNEFREWIVAARIANPRLRFAIHADQEVPYPLIHSCFETLRDLNITRFSLITDSRSDDSES